MSIGEPDFETPTLQRAASYISSKVGNFAAYPADNNLTEGYDDEGNDSIEIHVGSESLTKKLMDITDGIGYKVHEVRTRENGNLCMVIRPPHEDLDFSRGVQRRQAKKHFGGE